MAIKLAFSTLACPDWTIEKVAKQASDLGYHGVDLRTLGVGNAALASDPAQSNPNKIKKNLHENNIEPVCLSTSIVLSHKDASRGFGGKESLWEIQHTLELASQIGCPAVRIFAHEPVPGQSRTDAIKHMATQLASLTDRCMELGVQLLLENSGSLAKAKEWWWILNVVDHPMIGLCWNVANAAAAGENASVSVPMLNSRIRLAKVKDTHVGQGSGFVPLGDGTVGVEQFVKRLLGVGYDRYVTVEWDRFWLPSLAPPEEYLPQAQQRLQEWLNAIAEAEEKGRALAAKAAAKNAPKPVKPMAKAG